MRPSATESLYKDLESQEGVYEYNLPAGFCIRPLRLVDLEQVLELEIASFPESERATREKIEYRLRVCPELCAGVFFREYNWPKETPKSADREEDDDESEMAVVSRSTNLRSERLVGHIISTKTTSKYVTDESMAIGGHKEIGPTIAVHSVAIHPEFQGRHIGYVMMKDYVQKFFGLSTAEQMSLLAHKELVNFYRKHGFRDEGASESEFGGQPWRALRLPFDTYDEEADNL